MGTNIGADGIVLPGGQTFSLDTHTHYATGVATLVLGTVTVAHAAVTANSRIYLTAQNTSGVQGFLRVASRIAGASFTITSGSVLDTSTVAWLVVEP